MTRNELINRARELGVTRGLTKLRKPELIELVRDAESALRPSFSRGRGLVNGEPMPLHHRGRAMGAKHFLAGRQVKKASGGVR